ncbi:hypothetical protein Sango_1236500 [Sesamum angolense]|uniref:Reverse transcriptase domain-containing protein n=1 Tax=Sesamum angolense TaxID=2727404 RepID=A0AAE2BU32_9LAMI|nr:hypothetical protein Sango_1236500 [Sesamum angolense]
MKIGFWNVRGFNRPLKHNGVAHLIKNNQLCLLGILEIKIATPTIERIIHRSFSGWCQTNNFKTIFGGCILIIWNPAVIDLHPEDISPQKDMWEKVLELGQPMSMPWLILGDFNCCYFTNIPTVRAIPCGASLTGCFSTMSGSRGACNAMLISAHRDAFRPFTGKLKALMVGPLKAFNNLHFSHISVRAKEADLDLQDAQLQLESDHENAVIRDSLGELRKKVVFLAEAERKFYYQNAKIHFLKMGNQDTKFFHDMVKMIAAKSSILAITKNNGSIITSAIVIGQEFITYFTSLLGTEVQNLSVSNDVFKWGPKLPTEFALELCRAVTPLEVKQAIFHISDNEAPGPDGGLEWFPSRAFRRQERPSTRRPISPALFLLSMEYFSRLIKRKTSISDFNFHPKCEKLKITHLLFAIDLMLFSRGYLPYIHILIECLQEFRDIFGLAVNTSKSIIFTAWIENNEFHRILARTDFTRDEGGLGIQHIQSWNVALLARILWNIHRKTDMLWVQWVNNVWIGNRRRGIHHSFNGLSKFATEWSSHLAHQRRLSSTWEGFLHATDLRSYKRIAHALCASTLKNQPSTYSLSVHSVILCGPISGIGLASADICPPFSEW